MDSLFQQAKSMYPNASDDEINQNLMKIRQEAPNASDDEILKSAQALQGAQQSGEYGKIAVKESLKQKYGLGDPSERQKLVDANASAASPIAAAFAGFGAGLRGGDVASGFKNAMDASQSKTKGALDAFDKARDQKLQDFSHDRSLTKAEQEDKKLAEMTDPMSERSKAAQASLIEDYGMSPEVASKLTAEQAEARLPGLKQKLDRQMREREFDERQKDRNLQRESMRASRDAARQEKAETKARPSDKQIEAFTDIDNASSDLNNLLATLGDKSNWTGSVDGRIPDMFVGDDQVAWRSAVGKYKDAYRKAITGAGAGPTEIAMLEKRLPSETDTLANFQAKAKEALKELERRKATMTSNLEKGGKDVSKFRDESVPKSSGKVKVSNGKETLEIDESDVADAEADGYKRV